MALYSGTLGDMKQRYLHLALFIHRKKARYFPFSQLLRSSERLSDPRTKRPEAPNLIHATHTKKKRPYEKKTLLPIQTKARVCAIPWPSVAACAIAHHHIKQWHADCRIDRMRRALNHFSYSYSFTIRNSQIIVFCALFGRNQARE